jgi:DNA-binding transcriptional ArsR family regulator
MSKSRTVDATRMAGMLKALSNEHRLQIFLRLVSCCAPGTACTTDEAMGACVGEVGRDLGIVPSTVSHHIKELHRAGLISLERRGQSIVCSVETEALGVLRQFLAMLPGGAERDGQCRRTKTRRTPQPKRRRAGGR